MSRSSAVCCKSTVKLPCRFRLSGLPSWTFGFRILFLTAIVAGSLALTVAADETLYKPTRYFREPTRDLAFQAELAAPSPGESAVLTPTVSNTEEPHGQAFDVHTTRNGDEDDLQGDENDLDDEEEDDDDDEDRIEPIVQELFLGVVVYPQEKGEIQFTLGHFNGVEAIGNTNTFFETEYGITDRFQVGFEVPFEYVEEDEPFEGIRNLGLGLYYNFYNDRTTGRAAGVGCEFGFPVDAADGESRAFNYEPFFIVYQEFCKFAVNVSAGLDIDDPTESGEATETAGEVAVGIIGKPGPFVPLLECQVDIAPEETPVRLAPGVYCNSLVGPLDLAVSLPVGLNSDAPDFAVFFMAVLEFESGTLRSRRIR